ncbi:hypothetical protein [Iamia sp.]|uniref:hypothetical protein n=1 Tax=Iamia sp. TaxID=2722710 RepID=UPI002CFE9988|nr:hypothetical protein [Iamia sp.]HXH58024.1 hypothetical protein [Iamia sp.]
MLVVGRVDRHLGLLARLRGELDVAIERLTTARRLDAAAGLPLWAAWAAHDEAAARLQRRATGHAEEAQELLAGAAGVALTHGFARLGDRVRAATSTL